MGDRRRVERPCRAHRTVPLAGWHCDAAPAVCRATWGTAFAIRLSASRWIGIVCVDHLEHEYIGTMKPDDVAKVAGYELKLDGLTQRQGSNFREMIAPFTVSLDGRQLSVMTPRSAILPRGDRRPPKPRCRRARREPALYLARRAHRRGRAIAVRIYYKPMVLLIWWGPVLMAFGKYAVAFLDRRLRVGAPKPAKAMRGLQAAE